MVLSRAQWEQFRIYVWKLHYTDSSLWFMVPKSAVSSMLQEGVLLNTHTRYIYDGHKRHVVHGRLCAMHPLNRRRCACSFKHTSGEPVFLSIFSCVCLCVNGRRKRWPPPVSRDVRWHPPRCCPAWAAQLPLLRGLMVREGSQSEESGSGRGTVPPLN